VKRFLLAIAITWCGTRSAHAEPNATLALEPRLDFITGLQELGLLALDMSWRSPHPDWWFRGGAAIGFTSAVDEGQGNAYELRTGIEHKRRTCGGGCFYYGLDLAFVRGELYDDPEYWKLTGVVAVARGGIDIGGDHVRFRIGVEQQLGIGHVQYVGCCDSTGTELLRGFGLTTALVIVVE
jgi:hypothetical protein